MSAGEQATAAFCVLETATALTAATRSCHKCHSLCSSRGAWSQSSTHSSSRRARLWLLLFCPLLVVAPLAYTYMQRCCLPFHLPAMCRSPARSRLAATASPSTSRTTASQHQQGDCRSEFVGWCAVGCAVAVVAAVLSAGLLTDAVQCRFEKQQLKPGWAAGVSMQQRVIMNSPRVQCTPHDLSLLYAITLHDNLLQEHARCHCGPSPAAPCSRQLPLYLPGAPNTLCRQRRRKAWRGAVCAQVRVFDPRVRQLR